MPARETRGNRKYISAIAKALNVDGPPGDWTFTDRDVILYNISLGARRTDLPLVYERDANFHVLPTIGVIAPVAARGTYAMGDILPNFDPRKLVHGEQYLEVLSRALPTSGTMRSRGRLLEVVDKGNAALVRRGAATVDAATGAPLFYSESVAFVRGAGGFGGQRAAADRGAATAANAPPRRAPDAVVEERTAEDQAALYRLMGDRNPLHIDPKFSGAGGFPRAHPARAVHLRRQREARRGHVRRVQEPQGEVRVAGAAGPDARDRDVEGGPAADRVPGARQGEREAVHLERGGGAGRAGEGLAVKVYHDLNCCPMYSNEN